MTRPEPSARRFRRSRRSLPGAAAAMLAAAGCVIVTLLFLDGRHALHDFYETRPGGSLHLHYTATRRLVLLACACGATSAVFAARVLRGWRLAAAMASSAITVVSVLVGLQQSPAAFSGSVHLGVAFIQGPALFPEPQRREFLAAALLATFAAAASLAAALCLALRPARN